MERNLLALSLKHTRAPLFEELTFWGSRTKDDEKRSYGGYGYAQCAELYTMDEFKEKYPQSWYDYSTVHKTLDVLQKNNFKKLKSEFDTIFINYYEFIEISCKHSNYYKDKFKIDLLEKENQALNKKLELATKKKPRFIYADEPTCPSCFLPLDWGDEHCPCCDQRIDWKEQNEELKPIEFYE